MIGQRVIGALLDATRKEVALIDGVLSDLVPVGELLMLAIDGQTTSGPVIALERFGGGRVEDGSVQARLGDYELYLDVTPVVKETA